MKRSSLITLVIGCLAVAFCTVTMAEVRQAPGHRNAKRPENIVSPTTEARSPKAANVPGPKKAEVTTPSAKRGERAPTSKVQPTKSDSVETATAQKTARHSKKSKKAKLHAVAEPRKDITYHGILEGPSRYEPRRDHPTAGPPDPQTSELAYEHFQELDRNGDGSIDPVERAFGRLDMDHDLSKRQR